MTSKLVAWRSTVLVAAMAWVVVLASFAPGNAAAEYGDVVINNYSDESTC
jgi:hypothetical protein